MIGETEIRWKVLLEASPERVYDLVSTPVGRARFWAESAEEEDGVVRFRFADGQEVDGRVLEEDRPRRWAVEYFSGSRVEFFFEPREGQGEGMEDEPGTVVTLVETGFDPADRLQNGAGWVSVLLNLKAQADHHIDLRNDDPEASWDADFIDV